MFSIRGGKLQSTTFDRTGYEGQSLTGNQEDNTLKDQLQRNDLNDEKL